MRAPLTRDQVGTGLAYLLTLFNVWVWAHALANIAAVLHAAH